MTRSMTAHDSLPWVCCRLQPPGLQSLRAARSAALQALSALPATAAAQSPLAPAPPLRPRRLGFSSAARPAPAPCTSLHCTGRAEDPREAEAALGDAAASQRCMPVPSVLLGTAAPTATTEMDRRGGGGHAAHGVVEPCFACVPSIVAPHASAGIAPLHPSHSHTASHTSPPLPAVPPASGRRARWPQRRSSRRWRPGGQPPAPAPAPAVVPPWGPYPRRCRSGRTPAQVAAGRAAAAAVCLRCIPPPGPLLTCSCKRPQHAPLPHPPVIHTHMHA